MQFILAALALSVTAFAAPAQNRRQLSDITGIVSGSTVPATQSGVNNVQGQVDGIVGQVTGKDGALDTVNEYTLGSTGEAVDTVTGALGLNRRQLGDVTGIVNGQTVPATQAGVDNVEGQVDGIVKVVTGKDGVLDTVNDYTLGSTGDAVDTITGALGLNRRQNLGQVTGIVNGLTVPATQAGVDNVEGQVDGIINEVTGKNGALDTVNDYTLGSTGEAVDTVTGALGLGN